MPTPQPELMVPNPLRTKLEILYENLFHREATTIVNALSKTAAYMANGHVWIGSPATMFRQEVDWRHQRLQTLVNELVDLVASKLYATPEMISAAEARFWVEKRRGSGDW